MRTARVRPSDWLWKEGGGYYTEAVGDLALRPILPDVERLRDGRLFDLFRQHGRLGPESRVLEAGCGRSPWLPFLNRRFGCRVVGIDIEPHAADLARANIAGAGAAGEVVCGDAFTLSTRPDLRANYQRLFDYANNGGTLIVQYNVPEGGAPPPAAPAPAGQGAPAQAAAPAAPANAQSRRGS